MAELRYYRVALEYEVAESIAEMLPPDFAEETDIDSLADDRFLIAEPDLVLFPTITLPLDIDPSTIESRLSPVDLSDKRAEIGVARDQLPIEQIGDETRIIVTVRPEFDIGALQAEVTQYVQGVDGETLVDRIPHISRRDIPNPFVTIYDLTAPAARPRRGLDRVRNFFADILRSDGNAMVSFGIIRSHAFVHADNPSLTVSEIKSPPSPAILP